MKAIIEVWRNRHSGEKIFILQPLGIIQVVGFSDRHAERIRLAIKRAYEEKNGTNEAP